jgi:hypothetical protein
MLLSEIPVSLLSVDPTFARAAIPGALKQLRDEAEPLLTGAVGLPTPAASVAEWTINPSTGSDDAPDGGTLATMGELVRRWRGQKLLQYTLVNLPIGLPDEDVVLAGFEIGETGFLHIKGTPTTLQTGTATARTNQTGNIPNDLTDSALDDDWGPEGLIGERIRMTSGAVVGGISWALKDLTGKKAEVGLWYPSAFANPMPRFFTPGNISPGDSYVVESLPKIGSLIVDLILSDQKPAPKRSTRVIFEDVEVLAPDGIGSNSIGSNTGEGVAFLNCKLERIVPFKGGVQAWGSLLDSLSIQFGIAAAGYTLNGCCVSGGPVGLAGIHSLSDCVLADCTFVEIITGNTDLFNVGILDCGTDGLIIDPGAVARCFFTLWGAGNNGFGIRVATGGMYTPYSGLLAFTTITGTSGDTEIGGTVKTHAALQAASPPGFTEPNYLAMIREYV